MINRVVRLYQYCLRDTANAKEGKEKCKKDVSNGGLRLVMTLVIVSRYFSIVQLIETYISLQRNVRNVKLFLFHYLLLI